MVEDEFLFVVCEHLTRQHRNAAEQALGAGQISRGVSGSQGMLWCALLLLLPVVGVLVITRRPVRFSVLCCCCCWRSLLFVSSSGRAVLCRCVLAVCFCYSDEKIQCSANLLQDAFRLNTLYYITKQIIPSLCSLPCLGWVGWGACERRVWVLRSVVSPRRWVVPH
jgi:hypothetical protein